LTVFEFTPTPNHDWRNLPCAQDRWDIVSTLDFSAV